MSSDLKNFQQLASSRRRRRRLVVRRRGWGVQRLEPRCVMAADALGVDPIDWQADPTIDVEEAMPVPALFDSLPVDRGRESTDDSPGSESSNAWIESPNLDTELGERAAATSAVSVDLFSREPIELAVVAGEVVSLVWDPVQLESLFGDQPTMMLQVVYDASRWQADDHFTFDEVVDGLSQSGHNSIELRSW